MDAVLTLCDRLLGEIGRRQHLFGWLRAPDAAAHEWLPVDAYYPRRRLVVLCRPAPRPHDDLCRELIPKHGLNLLLLRPAELAGDPAAVREAVTMRISKLEPPPERALAPPPGARAAPKAPSESVVSRAVSSFAQPAPTRPGNRRRAGPSHAAAAQRAARFVTARSSVPRHAASRMPPARGTGASPEGMGKPGAARAAGASLSISAARHGPPRFPAGHPQKRTAGIGAPGLLVGAVLAAALAAEVYVDVAKVLGVGEVVLAFGVALDACARALGTIAAERAGRHLWAVACAIGGSPVVALFSLFRRSGPESVDPAPLAGLLALLAMGLLVLGAAIWALRI